MTGIDRCSLKCTQAHTRVHARADSGAAQYVTVLGLPMGTGTDGSAAGAATDFLELFQRAGSECRTCIILQRFSMHVIFKVAIFALQQMRG
jgi:hypothetical protein